MKKIEIKKEEKNIDENGIKKIDELYGRKISARKISASKKGIPLKPLRKEDVLKKDPVYASRNDTDEDVSDKKIKKNAGLKSSGKDLKKKSKSVMNDMLPKQKDVQGNGSHGKQAEDMTMEEYLKSKSAQSGADVKSSFDDENNEKGELAEDNILREDVVSDSEVGANEIDNADDNEEAAIAAMREEIKNKLKEKNNAEKNNISDNVEEASATQEKKSFFSRFSFRKRGEEIATKSNEDDIEAKKPDELSGLGEDERRVIEKRANRDNLIVAFLVFVIMSTVGATAFYFYVQYRSPGMVPNISLSSAEQAKKDVDDTKLTVSKAPLELPDDEEPILATVTDVNKLKNQKLFEKAQNGDRVLIYTINKKAILFRPSTNKIIEVSGFSYISSESSAKQPEESEDVTSGQINKINDAAGENVDKEEMIRIAVYNGSNIKGLAQKIGDMITLIPGTAITEKTNAKNEYEKTIVIDLSGDQEDMAKRIAESMDAEIVALPDGEKKPNAQILVIGGSNFKATE